MKIEIFYHHAIPGWCKIKGLDIKQIPEMEGGGYMLPKAQAEIIKIAFELENDSEIDYELDKRPPGV